MWSPRGGLAVSPQQLAADVPEDVQGVTLLGGEPFEQARALMTFASLVRSRGLSVMTFTGYCLEDLAGSTRPGIQQLLNATDLLIDGPYVAASPDRLRPWVGSTNQRFHFLTERYRHLEHRLESLPDRVELRIAPTGEVGVNGWATVDQLDELLADSTRPIGRGGVR